MKVVTKSAAAYLAIEKAVRFLECYLLAHIAQQAQKMKLTWVIVDLSVVAVFWERDVSQMHHGCNCHPDFFLFFFAHVHDSQGCNKIELVTFNLKNEIPHTMFIVRTAAKPRRKN